MENELSRRMEAAIPKVRRRSARLSPFVRLEGGKAHNPLSGFSIDEGSEEIAFLRALAEGEADAPALSEQAWDPEDFICRRCVFARSGD